jgi:hypothetical protein
MTKRNKVLATIATTVLFLLFCIIAVKEQTPSPEFNPDKQVNLDVGSNMSVSTPVLTPTKLLVK